MNQQQILQFGQTYHISDIMQGKGFRDFTDDFLHEQFAVGEVVREVQGQYHVVLEVENTRYRRLPGQLIKYEVTVTLKARDVSGQNLVLSGEVDVEKDTFVLQRGNYADLVGYQAMLAVAATATVDSARKRLEEDYSDVIFAAAMNHYREHPYQIPVGMKDLVNKVISN